MSTPLPPNTPLLSYERKFVPALAWSVRGAALQWGGRMTIVEDDGTVVFNVRAGTWGIFASLVLGVLALLLIGVQTYLRLSRIGRESSFLTFWTPLLVGLCLAATITCYTIAIASMKVWFQGADGNFFSMTRRGGRNWTLRDEADQDIGTLGTPAGGPGRLRVTGTDGFLRLFVEDSPVPGLSQATWRRLLGPGNSAKGRLRIGLGAGARVEIDDEWKSLDRRLLAALLISVALEGR